MKNIAETSPLFASSAAFRKEFERRLERLLDVGGLNVFILVAANASFDTALFAAMKTRLQHSYRRLFAQLRQALGDGAHIDEADDDLLVFLKIAAIGFEHLTPTEQRRAGVWEVQFNHLRAFRPLRNSQQPMLSIRAPFDARKFNFNKPFMQQEVLCSGEFAGRGFDLYYNKYPFVDSHCLLVVQRERCLPQYHRRGMHEFVWQLVYELADQVPGIRVGYNALGAYASVNHLHYQLFVREPALPVESGQWQHHGGKAVYPLACRLLRGSAEAWQHVEQLQTANQAYNLLYTPAGMYCVVRRKQGDFPLATWSNGFSWYEMFGGMITFNRRDYASLNESGISADLALARLNDADKS